MVRRNVVGLALWLMLVPACSASGPETSPDDRPDAGARDGGHGDDARVPEDAGDRAGPDAAVGESERDGDTPDASRDLDGGSIPTQSTCAEGNCGMPVGIPDPGGRVPAAIMPELPTASAQVGAFPYDPIGTATPTWRDGPQQFFVDGAASNCDDAANDGHGSPATPRCSIAGVDGATWSLEAGSQVFIHGDGATYGGDADLNSVTMTGTAEAPIWIIGTGETAPELRWGRVSWKSGQHVFFDSVHFRSLNDNFRMIWSGEGPAEYFTFRHVKCSGSDGMHSEPSRRCFSLGGSEAHPLRFVVFHDLQAWGLGRWQDDRDTSRDMFGIQIQKWVRYVWLLDSRIWHIQGDSLMCGNSNWWDFDHPSRPHYIYVGRNEFYENYENGYDQKGCYHVVFSENHVHDFYNAVKGANNTAIITEQDGEGDVGGRFCWFLDNRVERTGTPFAAKATTADADVYILGNLIRDFDAAGLLFTQRCFAGGSDGTTCPLGLRFAQNTVDCDARGTAISNVQNPIGSDQVVEIDGNVFLDCVDTRQGSPHGWESFSDEPLRLNHVQNAHYRASGDIALVESRYDELEGNLLNQPLLLANPDAGDYVPAPDSPVRGLVRKPNAAYALFEKLYGLDIRRDVAGTPWPEAPIAAGAFQ